MDRKSIALIVLCVAVLIFWEMVVIPKYNPPHPVATNSVAAATNPGAAQSPGTVPTLTAGGTTTTPANLLVHTNGPEEFLTISNAEARYIFTTRGGGLKEVQLLKYPATVSSHRSKNKVTNEVATLNDSTLPALFAIYGDDSLPGDADFKLSQTPDGGVRAERSFPSGLTIVKDFQLTTNYLMTVAVRFENRSAQPLKVPAQTWVAGGATPMDPLDSGMAETVFWYNGSKAASVNLPHFNTNTTSWGFSRTPVTSYTGGTNNVGWVSAQNQFFTLATLPKKPPETVVVHMVNLPKPTAEEIQANPGIVRVPMALQATLTYPSLTLPAGQSETNHFTLFAGPKEYQTIAQLAARFNNDIDLIMSFGMFSAISKALLVTMNWMHHALSIPYGWIMVMITVVIKMVFWPLTAASVRSSKRMQALQPQLKALQEKYKDDPQKATAKQWEFYKKNKVNPMSGCLPALVQIPVFFGFFGMLRGAIELRGAPFLWIGDLSKPDTVFSLPIPLHLLGFPDTFLPINPMPLIMGATLLWGASMAPPSPSMDPNQQKMMKYMPLIMLVFMYGLSSGLALYYTVSNLLTVVQNKVTRMQPVTAVNDATKPVINVTPQKKKKD